MTLDTENITVGCHFWKEVSSLAKEAFPPEEYLPPKELVKMSESGSFDFFAFKENERFIGFAAIKIYHSLAYLFFLAVKAEYRSRGFGSRALETLKERYSGKRLTVDFEMPDKTAANSRQRELRRNFYLRGGFKETGLFLSYLGVSYEVFCSDEDFDEQEFKQMMQTIRIEGFEPKYFKK